MFLLSQWTGFTSSSGLSPDGTYSESSLIAFFFGGTFRFGYLCPADFTLRGIIMGSEEGFSLFWECALSDEPRVEIGTSLALLSELLKALWMWMTVLKDSYVNYIN